jgi:hypothetical protein
MPRSAIAAIVPALLLTACATNYQVADDARARPGIPFYVRRAACVQETTYLEPIHVVTMSSEIDAKPLSSESFQLSHSLYRTLNVEKLMGEFTAAAPDAREKVWSDFATRAAKALGSASPSPDDVFLLSNAVAAVASIDYTTPYYLNNHIPWIGSSSSTIKLNADGTLGEAASNIEDKTVQTLLSVLPITAYVSKALGLQGKALLPAPTLTLRVDTFATKHTLSRRMENSSAPCGSAIPLKIPFEDREKENISYRRETLSPAAAPAAKQPEKPTKTTLSPQ